jgi:hypothetical protein
VGLSGALVGRVERGGAERPEDVVGAAGEFAGDGQRRAGVREPAGLEGVIVEVVGAGAMAGRLGGLVERPAQARGSLPAGWFWSGRREAPGPRGLADWPGFFPPSIEPCVQFSRTRLTDVLHRWHSAAPVPRLVGTRRDDGSVEVDQAQVVAGLASDDPPSPAPFAFVAVGDEDRQPVDRVERDLVEQLGGASAAEPAHPHRNRLRSCTTSSTGSASRSHAVISRTRLRSPLHAPLADDRRVRRRPTCRPAERGR